MTEPKRGVLQNLKRKAIDLLGGTFDLDQAATDLGMHVVMGAGFLNQRLDGLRKGLAKGNFAEVSNEFVTTSATPWLDPSTSAFHQDKLNAFHENYESYTRTSEMLATVKKQIRALKKISEPTAREAWRLDFLEGQVEHISRNKDQKALAMTTDSQVLLGFSFKPIVERPVIAKVPVILTKDMTVFRREDDPKLTSTLGPKA